MCVKMAYTKTHTTRVLRGSLEFGDCECRLVSRLCHSMLDESARLFAPLCLVYEAEATDLSHRVPQVILGTAAGQKLLSLAAAMSLLSPTYPLHAASRVKLGPLASGTLEVRTQCDSNTHSDKAQPHPPNSPLGT